jgi:DNA-binding response OmpR family regulator
MTKNNFRLLVLDDEQTLLSAMVLRLEKVKNLQVFSASTAEEGLRLLPQVDAILADCVFPQASMFEEAVRKSGKPIVRMSGKIERGLNLTLHKPFSGEELLDVVQMLQFLHAPHGAGARGAGGKLAA